MTPKNIFAIPLVVGMLSMPVVAQHTHEGQSNDDQKRHNMSEMMGRPTFEQTTDGMNIRVWLVTQAKHKQMMKDRGMIGSAKKDRHEMMGMMHGDESASNNHQMMDQMQHDGKAMDEEMMKAMLSGTHHIMVTVRDEASKAENEGAEVEIQIVSPTDKSSTVTLTRMMKHYGGGLTLEEGSRYRINVMVRVAGREVNAGFDYAARLSDQ